MDAIRNRYPRTLVTLRIAAALGLGYGFTWGFIALGTAGLYSLGMAFHDAEHLSVILGFLSYLTVFLWCMASRELARTCMVLICVGAFMAVVASLLQRNLI